MGIYMVSVTAEDWRGAYEGGRAEIAAGLNQELGRRGLPPYTPGPGPVPRFEEKTVPPMDGFAELCREHGVDDLLSWSVLVPVSLDSEITVATQEEPDEPLAIAGAPQVLLMAELLAASVPLPPEVLAASGPLALTSWYFDASAREVPGADTTFHTALYLHAARHCLTHGCPVVYS
ncbi:hypothetical protein [Streptomyces sp. XY332]|uniref:hypothetical protein n=1 Tax=Streptomyces sp. XY332 TaxID=1415561 RepID=UPI0006B153E9|nr:hypothetical protein [Streptomyces sp. XY332]KOY56628.1 hypothetical protein ADK59_17825 [Streptomyces sp. XY332]